MIRRYSVLLCIIIAISSCGENKTVTHDENKQLETTNVKESIEVAPGDSLIVEANRPRQITNRLHRHKFIHIKPGATLSVIDNSGQWCILWVEGDMILEGSLIFKNFRDNKEAITYKTPDGKVLSYQYRLSARGGAGGRGGNSSTGGRSSAGGMGANGTTEYGGGGGSGGGVVIMGNQSRIGGPGITATDWRGAPLARDGFENMGGNGAETESFGNGGLILIYCTGTLKGTGGLIDVSASNGLNGEVGGPGINSNRGTGGAGGGGGGAPGKEGGYVKIVAAHYEIEFNENVSGGRGGKGGAAGRNPNGALPGTKGQDGLSGIIDRLTLQEWNDNK